MTASITMFSSIVYTFGIISMLVAVGNGQCRDSTRPFRYNYKKRDCEWVRNGKQLPSSRPLRCYKGGGNFEKIYDDDDVVTGGGSLGKVATHCPATCGACNNASENAWGINECVDGKIFFTRRTIS